MRTRTVKDSYGQAIFASPVAIWLGLIVNNAIHFKANELPLLIFGHSLLCVYLLFGSLVASAPFAYVVLKIRNIPKIPNKYFYPLALIFGALCTISFIFHMQSMTVERHCTIYSSGFMIFGLLLNMLYFVKFIKENET